MVQLLFSSPVTEGPIQITTPTSLIPPILIATDLTVLPGWVGLNTYQGSNATLGDYAELVALPGQLPHIGVFNQLVRNFPDTTAPIACELLQPVGYKSQSVLFSTDFKPGQVRLAFLDLPSGFSGRLLIFRP